LSFLATQPQTLNRCFSFVQYTVPHVLKARTVEPEKQPLLANGSETTSAARQQIRNKYIQPFPG
jgi:hypothetical protein